jgi:hypothetical protein
MSDKGTYIVTVQDVADGDTTIVNRYEETDESINNLALRLEALAEAGFIGGFSIEGQNLPRYETPDGLYTAILDRFWRYPLSNEAKDGVDAILYDDSVQKFSDAWESGWRDRDAYFHRNAMRSIR